MHMSSLRDSSAALGPIKTHDPDARRAVGLLACQFALGTDDPEDTARTLIAALGLDQGESGPRRCGWCNDPMGPSDGRARRRRYCCQACSAAAASEQRREARLARKDHRDGQ